MKAVLALILVALLLGGAFLLGHKAGSPPRAPADQAKAAMQAPPQPSPARAVRVGGAMDKTACAAAVRIAPLPTQGAPFLTVCAVSDRLTAETQADLCEDNSGEGWLGIVYAAGGALTATCGVSTLISTQQAYAGARRSGWVSRNTVQLMAG